MTDRPVDVSFLKNEAVKYIDLSSLRIANCMGCFGCWTKTPGRCVIRDDATRVYPYIAASDTVLYVSRLCYGGYDSVMKTMLERAIPVQQAFIRIHKGETHHVQRAVMMKKATILAYGDISPEEQDIFRQLIARNAINMSFESYEVKFTTEVLLNDAVKEIVENGKRTDSERQPEGAEIQFTAVCRNLFDQLPVAVGLFQYIEEQSCRTLPEDVGILRCAAGVSALCRFASGRFPEFPEASGSQSSETETGGVDPD